MSVQRSVVASAPTQNSPGVIQNGSIQLVNSTSGSRSHHTKTVVLLNPPNVPVAAGPNVTFPNNKVDLGLFFGGSSAVFFAREEAKKLGTAGEDLPSEPGVPPKPN